MSLSRKLFWLRQILELRITGREPVTGQKVQAVPGLKTLGNPHGAWCIPTRHLQDGGIVYSLGVGTDTSFDQALLDLAPVQVWAFDPTPGAARHLEEHPLRPAKRFHFHPWGVWSQNQMMTFYAPQNPEHVSHSIVNLQQTEGGFQAPCKTLHTIREELGHGSIQLLKMDIEGAEYEVLGSMLKDGIHPDAVCVEYDEAHTPLDSSWQDRIRESARRVADAGYALVAVRPKCNLTFLRKALMP